MSKKLKKAFQNENGLKQSGKQHEIEIEYFHDFIQIWEKFKQLIDPTERSHTNWKRWQKICRENIQSVTKPFYEKWKHTNLLSWGFHIKKYASLTLKVTGGYLLIPYQFLLYESHYPGNDSLEALKHEPTDFGYEKAIFNIYRDLNIELKEVEFNILHKIANPRFTKSLDKFPTVKELTYGLRYKDERTINRGLNFLIWNSILSLIYLIDLSKIGYETDVVFHKKSFREIPPEILAHITMSFPINTDGEYISIIQYPNNNISKLERIESSLESTGNTNLIIQQRGWNLEGLTKKRINRWQLRPPALAGRGLLGKIIPAPASVVYNLDTYLDPYHLNSLEARLLGVIHGMSTMSENTLVSKLGVGREYITQAWRGLLQHQIITRFPIFSNIGLGGWVNFAIKGKKEKHEEIVTNFLRHLQFFPYRNVFSNNAQCLLVGSVVLPPKWVRIFLYRLAELPHYYDDLKYFYYIGPDKYEPWGLDIINTYDWGRVDKAKFDQE
ncbi:MAG: hypothetical protein ACW97X_01510 [Candidatus Hodarchaeales archaeon]|jgi:hypothetical protein